MAADQRPTLVALWDEGIHLRDGQPFRLLSIVNCSDRAAREVSVAVEHQGNYPWDTEAILQPDATLHVGVPLAAGMVSACAFIEMVWVAHGPLVTPRVTITWKPDDSEQVSTLESMAPKTPDPIPADTPGSQRSSWLSPAMFVPGVR